MEMGIYSGRLPALNSQNPSASRRHTREHDTYVRERRDEEDGVTTLEPMEVGQVDPLPLFMHLTGLGRHACRAARRAGLRVRYRHGRGFVTGSDWLAYLEADAPSKD
jgi:hypothetical protein